MPILSVLLKKHKLKLGIALTLFIVWLFCLPNALFNQPTSTVALSANGQLMGARIAKDGQWRFPAMDTIPYKYEQCILLFEDEYFYQHPGFNPISILKAIHHNITKKSRRGGSTITQQVIRLSRGHRKRNYAEKLIELVQATRLEARFSKNEILRLYASHTPYGGNVVGLETAAWRYFGISAKDLSWGQTAALAVLPNAPALIFPGKNDNALLKKRNRLLQKLHDKKILDATELELALLEPLPQKPLPLPNFSPHLTERIQHEHTGKQIRTTIDATLQKRLNRLAKAHHQSLAKNEINNLAILVLDVTTRNVLAYVGNAPNTDTEAYFVDIINKKRSTGSTLKPLLFAALMDEGQILPNTLVKDIPTVINGYQPENFTNTYAGAVPASNALARSLNIPAVRLLQAYGLQKFYNKLQQVQLPSLNKPASHYGLPLILGGAEATLWELTAAYANMASVVNHFSKNNSTYRVHEFKPPNYLANQTYNFGNDQEDATVYSAGAIFETLQALRKVNRPKGEENWHFFSDSQPLAWKTGTSFGFKDAWAIGVTPKYAIGVWAGNADGEGRPGLTGITAAAPLLFKALQQLPKSGWFATPYDDLMELPICDKSGFEASPLCEKTNKTYVPLAAKKGLNCPYHQQLSLDETGAFQVNANCYPIENIVTKPWFVLPATMAFYYEKQSSEYKSPPPFLSNCGEFNQQELVFLYPKKGETLVLPKDLGNQTQDVLVKVAHKLEDLPVHWYLDEGYVGTTTQFHELLLPLKPGSYKLSVMDDNGNLITQNLRVITTGMER